MGLFDKIDKISIDTKKPETRVAPVEDQFKADPETTISMWRASLLADVKAGKLINEYAVSKTFKNLSGTRIRDIVIYIMENYAVELKIPTNKIRLARAKDEIENYLIDMSEWKCWKDKIGSDNLSTEHLIVILFSITGKNSAAYKKDETVKDFAFKNSELNINTGTIPTKENAATSKNRKYIIGKGKNAVAFISDNGFKCDERALYAKLKNVYELITMINTFIPNTAVHKVELSNATVGKYNPDDNSIIIDPEKPFYLQATCHEMGHAIYFGLLLSEENKLLSKDDKLNFVFAMSLPENTYEIVDDSNYLVSASDGYGHPYDFPGEFFASSVYAFITKSDEFINNINSPDTPEKMNAVGKYIYCYLRDVIFRGIFIDGKYCPKEDPLYAQNNPFRENWDDLKFFIDESDANLGLIAALKDKKLNISELAAFTIGAMKNPELLDMLLPLLQDKDSYVRQAALHAIGELRIQDERLVKPIIRLLEGADGLVAAEAACTIGKLHDGRFVEPLFRLLKVSKGSNLWAVVNAIGRLGIKDEGYIRPLINLLKSKNAKIANEAEIAIINLKDERFIDPLFILLKSEHFVERSIALSVLRKYTDTRFTVDIMRNIFAAYKSPHWYERQSAIYAVESLDMNVPIIRDEVLNKILMEGLADSDTAVVSSTIFILYKLQIKDKRIIPIIISASKCGDYELELYSKAAIEAMNIDIERGKFKD